MATESILLESGTNEVEILEFVLNGQGFGVNVAKVQAIEQYDTGKVTRLPRANDSIAGVLMFRNRTLPLVDLATELNVTTHANYQGNNIGMTNDEEKKIVLVLEFNGITSAIVVDGVNRIHRVSWSEISPLSPTLAKTSAVFTGSVNIEKREILIVDMEKILAALFPESALQDIDEHEVSEHRAAKRSDVRIYLAEDSSAIRTMVLSVLSKAGYVAVTGFADGASCHEAIQQLQQRVTEEDSDIGDFLNIIISDIEMPRMDGLTLCRNIKTSELRSMPVILFSSLINDQMAAKCRSVGADDYISKPNSPALIAAIDRMCLSEDALSG